VPEPRAAGDSDRLRRRAGGGSETLSRVGAHPFRRTRQLGRRDRQVRSQGQHRSDP
jgi:hypothetical protein